MLVSVMNHVQEDRLSAVLSGQMSVCVSSHGMSDRSLKSTSGNRANCSSHLRIFWLSILPRMNFMI